MTETEAIVWTIILYACIILVLYLSRDTKPKL